jgi:hypothetical protein
MAKVTMRELFEEAAGMPLDMGFFMLNGINPNLVIEVEDEEEDEDS